MENKEKPGTSDLIHLSYFTEIGKTILSSKNLKQTLSKVMEHVGTIFAPRNWSLLLLDSKSQELVFSIVIGKAAEKLKGVRIPADQGISGWILKTGQSVIVEDVTKDNRFNSKIDDLTGFTTESIIGVPLKSVGKIYGVIELINKINGEPFTPFDLQVLSTIADFTAVAIEKCIYVNTIKKISLEDPLTGVLNRRGMDSILTREIERSKRYKTSLSILMVDIDDFKSINDNLGHPAGDAVLCRCAEILKNCVRKVDYIVRYGGDEFAVIMPDTIRENAILARDRILKALEDNRSENADLAFSVSIGLHSAVSASFHEIIEYTDQDLYKRKISKDYNENEDCILDLFNQ